MPGYLGGKTLKATTRACRCLVLGRLFRSRDTLSKAWAGTGWGSQGSKGFGGFWAELGVSPVP